MSKVRSIINPLFVLAMMMVSFSPVGTHASEENAIVAPSDPAGPLYSDDGYSLNSSERMAETSDAPEPLPHDCGGVAPNDPDACCAYGYAYHGDEPVFGASVRIESAHGVLTTATTSGIESSNPYYVVELSSTPLFASADDVITITTSYSDMVSARTWTVQDSGQQVDLGLVTGYRATEPMDVSGVDGDESASTIDQDQARRSDPFQEPPLAFIENVGQFDERARFQVSSGYMTLFLAHDALWVSLAEPSSELELTPDMGMLGTVGTKTETARGVSLKLSFAGANPHPRLEPFNKLDTQISFFTGSDRDQWRTDVPAWGGVRYVDLYPGLDLEVTSQNGQLVQRLVVRERLSLQSVRLRVEGADNIALEDDHLRLITSLGEFALPLLTLEGAASRVAPAISVADEGYQVSTPFASTPLPAVNATSTSTPTLLYSTYLGGDSSDKARDIAVDEEGNAYVIGQTSSTDFPTTTGAFNTSYNGGTYDVFVTKLSTDGNTLLYNTYLGGNGEDAGIGITVDSTGSVYITGKTYSTDFPTTPNALDTTLSGDRDAFMAKLNAAGDDLVYSTYLGGNSWDYGKCVAIDDTGNAYVGGFTHGGFPTTSGVAQESFGGSGDGFAVKLNLDGSTMLYSTYLGGYSWEAIDGIAVDNAGNAYLASHTHSTDFPTTPGAWDRTCDNCQTNYSTDGAVAKLNADGSEFIYSTLVGGADAPGGEEFQDIAIDSAGNAYLTGHTCSTDFPTTTNSLQPGFGGGERDAVVVKLNADGSDLLYSTYLGGGGTDRGSGIVIDGDGEAYVTGYTASTDFATVNPLQAANAGGYDAFVVKMNDTGSALLYSTYLGGSGDENIHNPPNGHAGIASNSTGNVYITGFTDSTDFPTTALAYDTSSNGGAYDAFVTKMVLSILHVPFAAFTGSSLSGIVPLTVAFVDQSTGDIVAWDWTFGDGSVSGARHPEHEYTDVGTYDVALTVTGPGGSDTETKTGYVTVNPPGSYPPIASISFIYPNPATQGQDMVYLNGSGYDTDENGAYVTAYEWNSTIDGQLSTDEDFTVQASELSAGSHTVAFKVQDDEEEWSQTVTRTLTIQSTQADVSTLILVNRQKLESFYDGSEVIQLMDKLNELAAHDSVKGRVVQVEIDGSVATAYAAWDADPTNLIKANAVAESVKAVVDAQWATYPDLEYLVIVGDDRAIPFRRVLDQTRHPERNYRHVSPSSTTGAALGDDMTLTDDYYADAASTVPDSPDWDGHDLYIPDLGTGRLIETPSEIIAQIDAFLAGEEVAVGEAIVTGYDFVKDGAQGMCSELNGDGLTTDCTLIGESWDSDDLIAQVLNERHEIASINGHASHYVIDTPSGSVFSIDVAGAAADHTGALFYTLGCHSGLNVPPTNPSQPLDTAQALAQRQANYVANTGYGWGFRASIGLSEQLLLDFTEQLVYGQSATAGQALAAAKQEYYLNEGDFDYYDEKVMIESTLYGLPMYRYTTPTAATARLQAQGKGEAEAAIKEELVTTLGNGLTVNSLSYQFPALLAESTDDGLYYSFGGLAHAGDGEPIQPKYTADLSFPETEAHGVVFKGGVYTDVVSFDPVVDRAITETTALAEPAFDAPGWYPALPHRLNRLERGDKLVTLLGQFNPNEQVERVYDQLSFDVYYHTSSDDWTAPSIASMSSELEAESASIAVGAEDDSGIEAVVIAYTDGDGAWDSVGLTESGGVWSGSFPADEDTQFFVQVVDNAGNVIVSDNGGQYFKPGEGVFGKVYLPLILSNSSTKLRTD